MSPRNSPPRAVLLDVSGAAAGTGLGLTSQRGRGLRPPAKTEEMSVFPAQWVGRS